MVYIILGEGFEPVEALAPCDILRRGGVEVKLAGIGGLCITGGHGIRVCADCTVEEINEKDLEMIVLPGGLGGVQSILGCDRALQILQNAYHSDRLIAAICAAPTVLAKLGMTDGKNATCYPGCEDQMAGASTQAKPCVRDGRIITGQAAGASFAFGLELLRALRGEQVMQKVKSGMVID